MKKSQYMTALSQATDWQCVYEESELSHVEIPPLEVQLFKFELEEDMDRDTVNEVSKHYEKTLRYLFSRYVQTERQASRKRLLQKEDYDHLQIRLTDVFRLLKDFEIQDLATYEEIINLMQQIHKHQNVLPFHQDTVRQLNQSQLQHQGSIIDDGKSVASQHSVSPSQRHSSSSQRSQKSNLLRLDYQGFIRFLLQYALMIFSRAPKDLRNYPAGYIYQELFRILRNTAKFILLIRRKGDNFNIFEDPNGINMVADPKTIMQYNLELSSNPKADIPPKSGLKKVIEQEVQFQYRMKPGVLNNLRPSWLIAFEFVNEIVNSRFKSMLIEPISQVRDVAKVYPLYPKGVHKDKKIDELALKQETLKESLAKFPIISKTGQAPTAQEKRIEELKRSLEMSMSPSRFLGTTANDSVLAGSASIKRMTMHERKKLIEKQEEELQRAKKDAQFQKHREELKKKMETVRDKQFEKEQEKLRLATTALEDQIKESNQRQYKSQLFMAKQKEKLQKNQSTIFTTYKEDQANAATRKLEKQKKLDEERKNFFKTEGNRLKAKLKQWKENMEIPQNREEYKKITQQKENDLHGYLGPFKAEGYNEKTNHWKTFKHMPESEKDKKIAELTKKRAEHYKVTLEKKIEYNKKFKDLFQSVGASLQKYRKRNKHLFLHFLAFSDSDHHGARLMQLDAWNKFCYLMNIAPEIITPKKAQKVFLKTLKIKNKVEASRAEELKKPFKEADSLTFFDFEVALVRLTVKMETFLNQMGTGKDAKQVAEVMAKFKYEKDKLQKERQLQEKTQLKKYSLDKIERQLKQLDRAKAQTFDALLDYLNLPQDEDEFAVSIRAQNKKAIPGKTEVRPSKKDYVYDKLTMPREIKKQLKQLIEEESQPPKPKTKKKEEPKEPPLNYKKALEKLKEEELTEHTKTYLKKLKDEQAEYELTKKNFYLLRGDKYLEETQQERQKKWEEKQKELKKAKQRPGQSPPPQQPPPG